MFFLGGVFCFLLFFPFYSPSTYEQAQGVILQISGIWPLAIVEAEGF